MKKFFLTVLCLFLLITLASCNTQDSQYDDNTETDLTWTGTWDTEFSVGDDFYKSEMILSQTQNSVTGTYSYESFEGDILASSEGLTLVGVSIENTYEYPIEFLMDPSGKSFTGVWYEKEGDSEPIGSWNGTRR